MRANLNENPLYRQVLEIAEAEGSRVVPICGKIEEELSQMEPEDRQMFLEELGLHQSGLDRLVTAGYDLLGLISFLTAGKPEVRAWTITKGTKAPGRQPVRSTATLSAGSFGRRSFPTKL